MTVQADANGKSFIAPAHTSTMQNRVLIAHKAELEAGLPIAVVILDAISIELPALLPLVPRLEQALAKLTPRTCIRINA